VTELVSIITPTFGRDGYLARTLRWVFEQTYTNLEWLVLDDSPQPSRFLATNSDPRIRYSHSANRLSIGEKRNRLVEEARGNVIVHFDDDDYYAPRFVETMLGCLERNGGDFVNLSSWYLYDMRHEFFGYWDLKLITGLHFMCYADGLKIGSFAAHNNAALVNNHLGYGFTYAYRKKVWTAGPFPSINWGEDMQFVMAAMGKFQLSSVSDSSGLVLHVLHRQSSSSCFPQYRLPNFHLPALFGDFQASDT